MSINVSQYYNKVHNQRTQRAKVAFGAILLVSILMIIGLVSIFSTEKPQSFSKKNFILFIIMSLAAAGIITWQSIWILARKNDNVEMSALQGQLDEYITLLVNQEQNKQIKGFIEKLNSNISGFSNLTDTEAIHYFHQMIINLMNFTQDKKLLSHHMDQFANYSYDIDSNLSSLLSFSQSYFSTTTKDYFSLYALMKTFYDSTNKSKEKSLNNVLFSDLIKNNQNISIIYSKLGTLYPDIQPENIVEKLRNIYQKIISNNQMWQIDPSEKFFDYKEIIASAFNSTNGSINNITAMDVDNLNLENANISSVPSSMQIGLSQVDNNLNTTELIAPLNNLYIAFSAQNLLNELSAKLNELTADFNNLPQTTTNLQFKSILTDIIDEKIISITDSQVNQLHQATKSLFSLEYPNLILNTSSKIMKLQDLWKSIPQILNLAGIQQVSDDISFIITNKLAFFPLFVKNLQRENIIPPISVKNFLENYTSKNDNFLYPDVSPAQMDSTIFNSENFKFNLQNVTPYVSKIPQLRINADAILNLKEISDSFQEFLSSFKNFFLNVFSKTLIIPGEYNCYKDTNVSLPNTTGGLYLSEIIKQRDSLMEYIKSKITTNGTMDLQSVINNDLNSSNPDLNTNLKKYFAYFFAIMQINSFIDGNYDIVSVSNEKYTLQNQNGIFDCIELPNLLRGKLSAGY